MAIRGLKRRCGVDPTTQDCDAVIDTLKTLLYLHKLRVYQRQFDGCWYTAVLQRPLPQCNQLKP